MRLRSVLEEYEAHLTAPAGDGHAKGKAERKRYGTGEQRLKVRASGLAAPDGSRVDIRLDRDVIGCATVAGGRISFAIESPESVPLVRAGQVLRLAVAGAIVLAGELRAE